MKRKPRKPRNKFEEKLYRQCSKAKTSFEYETEKIAYIIAGHYLPDFILKTPLGKIYVEAKGYFRPEHKRKLIAVKKLNPQLDIRIVFYANKKEYIRWAERNGFKYSIGNIPDEWFKGL